ncbi:hypothetical protein C479_14143 [Halovivax asiaticus JCM 14624]|uniref:Uncharacterized protein n=1 Tax=Halovivax asiaticus JCM 14624 TaxID=1227490 RepID=M0BC49_9EURY|nr:hypothetical protein [Halovivax asiaticus]ELZ08486.1 hypothetical protein C479_14143 [Halovivax asiaticus JCM 14624]
MTGGSYRRECWACEASITMAARYCPHCGEVQSHEGDDVELATVERAVLEELVENAKGKLEGDVSRFGPDATGYDTDEFAATIEAAEDALDSVPSAELRADGGTTVSGLESRVAKLESIINRELGYNLGNLPMEPQTVDCVCGEAFEVNVINGLVCPECGRGSDDRDRAADTVTGDPNGGDRP